MSDGEAYAHFFADGQLDRAHRWAYRHWIGPIPDGLVIDHVYALGCRHLNCANPHHLEAVSQRENAGRGVKARQTHCIHGHKFTPENTYRRPADNCRVCRECNRLRELDKRRRLRLST